jgi:hypothetical protein
MLALGVTSALGLGNSKRVFPKIVPPGSEEQIAARNAEDKKLYSGVTGDWRKHPKPATTFSQDASPASRISNVDGGDASETRGQASGETLQSVTPNTSSTTAKSTFVGFRAAPSYQAIPLPVDGKNWVLATATADLNNDGYPDAVNVDVSGNLNVALNDGKGGLQTIITNSGAKSLVTISKSRSVWITAGDLNGDGLTDLVVTSYGTLGSTAATTTLPSLLVYINKGNGVFAAPVLVHPTLDTSEQIGGVLINDQNGDGLKDIVVVSYEEIDYSNGTYDTNIHSQTLFSRGDGTFTNGTAISSYLFTGYSLLIPNGGAQYITLHGAQYVAVEAIAYGNGSEYLTEGATVLFFAAQSGVSGSPLASSLSQEVDFGTESNSAISNSNGLSLTDTNGDGYPDITLSFGDYYLWGASGKSDGTFGSASIIENGTFPFHPSGWVLYDTDGDGYPDMVDMEQYYTAIWKGTGDGTFADPKIFYSTPVNNSSYQGSYPGNNLVVADFDKDGIPDIAFNDSVQSNWYGRTTIAKGRSNGSFDMAQAFGSPDGNMLPSKAYVPVVGDINGDGLSDVVLTNMSSGVGYAVASAISNGSGGFKYNATALPYYQGNFQLSRVLAAGDINGDGCADLVLLGKMPRDSVYSYATSLSNCDGTFATPVIISPGSLAITSYPNPVFGTRIADVNNDGHPDVVLYYPGNTKLASSILIAYGNGDGTFQQFTTTAYGSRLTIGAIADFNKDGYADTVVYDSSKSMVSFLPGLAAGGFSTASAITVASSITAYDILTFDFNNDGNLDLALVASTGVLVYQGDGKGGFTLASTVASGLGAQLDGAVADFNGDGCPDIFTGLYTTSTATATNYGGSLYLGSCNGTFQKLNSILIPPTSDYFSVGTFNYDGAPGLVAYTYYGSDFVLQNLGGTTTTLTPSAKEVTDGQTVSLTATVQPTFSYLPVPSGSVTYYDNGSLIDTQSLAGQEAVSTVSLATGNHVITASYLGDDLFNQHLKSAQTNVKVDAAGASTVTPEFSIRSSQSAVTVNEGNTGSVTLTIVGNSAYSGTVSLSASGATNGLGVNLDQSLISLSGGSKALVNVKLSTQTTQAKNMQLKTGGAVMALGFCGLGIFLRRRKLKGYWLVVMLLSCITLVTLDGCASKASPNALPGTYTIVINATPSVSTASAQTATFTVTVQ